jgi:short-subunit dehydrogenase
VEDNSWALVTGASSGLGEAYCYELAKAGFNIILLARSMEEMKRVSATLTTQYYVKT